MNNLNRTRSINPVRCDYNQIRNMTYNELGKAMFNGRVSKQDIVYGMRIQTVQCSDRESVNMYRSHKKIYNIISYRIVRSIEKTPRNKNGEKKTRRIGPSKKVYVRRCRNMMRFKTCRRIQNI